MIKTVLCLSGTFILSALLAVPADAQIVTSYYAPQATVPGTSIAYTPGAVLTPAVVAQPVVTSPVIGTIPVRRGLFGLRTEQVPVFSGAPVVASVPMVAPVSGITAVARPAVSAFSLPYNSAPYASARPIVSVAPLASSAPIYTSGTAMSVVNPPLPNALIQSGYRGAVPVMPVGPAPVMVAPAPVYPFNAGPYNSFYPGAVMTMQ